MGDSFRRSSGELDGLGDSADRATGKVLALKDAADRPATLTGSFGGRVGPRGDISGSIDLRDGSGEQTAQEKAAGVVNRSVSSQSIDHELVARSLGLSGPEVKAFVAAFGEALNDEMAQLKNKLLSVGVTSTEGYLTEYAGSLERAKARARDEAKQSVARDERASAPASTHRVEIVLNGKTTSIDTTSPDAAAALISTLKELQWRAA